MGRNNETPVRSLPRSRQCRPRGRRSGAGRTGVRSIGLPGKKFRNHDLLQGSPDAGRHSIAAWQRTPPRLARNCIISLPQARQLWVAPFFSGTLGMKSLRKRVGSQGAAPELVILINILAGRAHRRPQQARAGEAGGPPKAQEQRGRLDRCRQRQRLHLPCRPSRPWAR